MPTIGRFGLTPLLQLPTLAVGAVVLASRGPARSRPKVGARCADSCGGMGGADDLS
jgi:hypothetical protein